MYSLILVSKSPRRRDILAKAGYNFVSDHIKVSEIIDKNLNIDEAMKLVARQKSVAYLEANNHLKSQEILLISADTLVLLEDRVLGKPKNESDAFEYLSLLSGKTHCVKTALCVYDLYKCQMHCFVETTEVEFKNLDENAIWDYIRTGEPFDKAGAYAIQGIGKKLVKDYIGSWHSVVGFPLELFEKILNENDWSIDKK